jgi:nicotinamidase-related amidase
MGLLGGSFGKGDGLLVVDVQIDFCPGGTRPVTPEGGKKALAKMKAAGAEIL